MLPFPGVRLRGTGFPGKSVDQNAWRNSSIAIRDHAINFKFDSFGSTLTGKCT